MRGKPQHWLIGIQLQEIRIFRGDDDDDDDYILINTCNLKNSLINNIITLILFSFPFYIK